MPDVSPTGYGTPYSIGSSGTPYSVAGSFGSTPSEQAKYLRAMQQKWKATAEFFREQEKCSPVAAPPLDTSVKSPSSTPHAKSPSVKIAKTKVYSPGVTFAKTVELDERLDGWSECSTADATASTPASPGEPEPAYVTELSEVNAEPKLPTLEALPSLGSVTHATGNCKPCAFLNTKGCANGADCTFCHLCERGEKKRRFKEKKAHFNALREVQQQLQQPHFLIF
jgi:hypothetical protein